jgi:flagellar biosynthesis chaperone FliJ
MGLQHGAGTEMKNEGLKWFLDTLHKARKQTRYDLQHMRAKVDALAEKEVELTQKIESMEETLRERGAA